MPPQEIEIYADPYGKQRISVAPPQPAFPQPPQGVEIYADQYGKQPINIDTPQQVIGKQPEQFVPWIDQWNDLSINKPLTHKPTEWADLIAEPMMQYGEGNDANDWLPTLSRWGGAFIHNFGEGVSGLTSPINLATLGAGAAARGAAGLALKAAPPIARALNIGARGLDIGARATAVPQALSGVGHLKQAYDEGDWTKAGTGAIETGLGVLGLRSNIGRIGGAAAEPFIDPNVDWGARAQQQTMDLGQPLPNRRPGELPFEDLDKSVLGGQDQFKGLPKDIDDILRRLGLSDAQIARMTPQQKWDLSQHEDTTFPGGGEPPGGGGGTRMPPDLDEKLRALGLSEEQIGNMTPSQKLEIYYPKADQRNPRISPTEGLPESATRTSTRPPAEPGSVGTGGRRVISKNNWTSPELALLRNAGWKSAGAINGKATWFHPEDFPNGPPTPEEVRAEARPETPTQQTSPQAPQTPPLPRDLAGARPRYQNYELEFANDLDRALYIVAQENPSPRDADYMRYVLEHVDTDETSAREMGREVRSVIAERVRGLPAGVVKLERIANIADEAPATSGVKGKPFNEDEDIVLNNPTKTTIERMYERGYRVIETDENGDTVFSRTGEPNEPAFQQDRDAPGGQFGRVARFIRDTPFIRAARRRVEALTAKGDYRTPQDEQTLSSLQEIIRQHEDAQVAPRKGPDEPIEPQYQIERGEAGPTDPPTIFKIMEEKLRKVDDIKRAHFLMPDGKMYRHDGPIHAIGLRMIGLQIEDVLNAGVIRIASGGSAEVHAPITMTQARILAEGGSRYGLADEDNSVVYIDVVDRANDYYKGRVFTGRAVKPGVIKDWVAAQFNRGTEPQFQADRITDPKAIIEAFRTLPKPETDRQIRFILPDGETRTHRADSHFGGAQSVNTDLEEALAAGVIRFYEGSAEVSAPITMAQARVIADYAKMHDDADVYIDITGKVNVYQKFNPNRVTASALKDWINSHFDKLGEGKGPMFSKASESIMGLKLLDRIARTKRLQQIYDSMTADSFQVEETMRPSIVYDPGNRMTPEERTALVNNPFVQDLLKHYHDVLDGAIQMTGRMGWELKLEHIGISLEPGIHGIAIHNPADGAVTILFNPLNMLSKGKTPAEAAWRGTITQLHEIAHIGTEEGAGISAENPVRINYSMFNQNDPRMGQWFQSFMEQITQYDPAGGHGVGFIHRLGEIYGSFGLENTFRAAAQLESIYTKGNRSGGYSPEVQKLLQIYKESRGREATAPDFLSGEGIEQADTGARQERLPGFDQTDGNGTPPGRYPTEPAGAGGTGGNRVKITIPGGKKQSWKQELYNLPRGATTTMDLSAPLRQGLPLIYRKEFWKSWKQMLASFGSEGAYRRNLDALKQREMFQRLKDPVTGEPISGPKGASFAERVGMKLTEVGNELTAREEAVASNWVETGGNIPGFSAAYRGTVGKLARASNRAYTAFLNQLRADTFESLMKDAQADFDAGTKGARDPFTDIPFAKEIADFVNTATGRGPLRTTAPWGKEYSLEQHAKLLTNTIFSPRLMASRVRMLNPGTYVMASPFVRKQYMKAFLSTAAAWGTVSGVAAMAGADVSTDPESADFGKIRIGNTRLDPAAGFQQYFVTAARLLSGRTTSSASGLNRELGQGFQATTRRDIIDRFGINKLHPVLKFANDLLAASQYQPFNVGDRTAQMFVPLVIQDVVELAKEDPNLLPLLAPIIVGMGSQTYDKGTTGGKLIPPSSDWVLTGGAPENEIPKIQNVWDDQAP